MAENGKIEDASADLARLETQTLSAAITRVPEGGTDVPALLFICPGGWGRTAAKKWHEDVGISLDLVEEYRLVPWGDLGRYRVVLFYLYPFIDNRTGTDITAKILGKLPLDGPPTEDPGALLADGFEYCIQLISRLRAANPDLFIVVLRATRDFDQRYTEAGADYIYDSEVGLIGDDFPEYLKSLLSQ